MSTVLVSHRSERHHVVTKIAQGSKLAASNLELWFSQITIFRLMLLPCCNALRTGTWALCCMCVTHPINPQ